MGAGYRMLGKAQGSAEIYIYEDVGESWFGGVSAKQFATDLKALGAVQTLDVRINSAGGDVFDGQAIYRQLVEHAAKVVVHVDGVAASIASVIAMAGDEIRISEAGFMMIHDAWGFVTGTSEDMRKRADLLDMASAASADVYSARSKQTVGQVREWMREEKWFTGAEAVASGFADQVDANLRVAAHLDVSKHTFQHAPAALGPAVPPLQVPKPSINDRTNLDIAGQRHARLSARLALAR